MKTKKIALYGILISLSLILSYIELLIPMPFTVPGVKIGLPNIAVLFALYKLSGKGACAVSLIRVLLVSILFGSFVSLAYSLSGAVLSLLVMILLKKSGKFSTTGISVAGGVAHNAGQIMAAILILDNVMIAGYLPVLCVSGTVAGILIGLLASLLIKRIKLNSFE